LPKVLRIINRFNLGGITYNVSYLSKFLAPEFETLLIGGDKEPGEDSSLFIPEQLGLKPFLIPEMKRAISFKDDRTAYIHIKKIIREFKPDIVHTHASKAGAIGRLAAFHEKVPAVVHTFHGHVFHSYFGTLKTNLYKGIERYLAKKSSAIIAISEKQKKELTEIYKISDPDKTHVIHLGFDLNKFRDNQSEKRATFRKHYLIDDDEIAIVIIGRLAPIKNHEFFLRIISKVTEYSQKKIRAFIVGDGETHEKLENYCNQLQLDFCNFTNQPSKKTITFTSWITNVDWPLAGCDIVCMTSFNEGTPVSLIEAQAAGKPVISTNVGGVSDILSKECGFLIEQENENEFFSQLLQIIENDELRNSLGKNGWLNVGQKFHYNKLVENTRKLYHQLL
jgi:glycosyltransferase involved in cell wall biosynthesis